jgi:hypothetical protein
LKKIKVQGKLFSFLERTDYQVFSFDFPLQAGNNLDEAVWYQVRRNYPASISEQQLIYSKERTSTSFKVRAYVLSPSIKLDKNPEPITLFELQDVSKETLLIADSQGICFVEGDGLRFIAYKNLSRDISLSEQAVLLDANEFSEASMLPGIKRDSWENIDTYVKTQPRIKRDKKAPAALKYIAAVAAVLLIFTGQFIDLGQLRALDTELRQELDEQGALVRRLRSQRQAYETALERYTELANHFAPSPFEVLSQISSGIAGEDKLISISFSEKSVSISVEGTRPYDTVTLLEKARYFSVVEWKNINTLSNDKLSYQIDLVLGLRIVQEGE